MCRQLTRHLDLADISSCPSRAGAAPSPAFTAPCSGVTQVHLPPWNQKQRQGVSGWLDTKWTLIICARRHARVHILLLKQEQECSFLKTSGSLHTSSTPNHFFNCERKKATYNPGSLEKNPKKNPGTSVYNHQVNHQNTCERVAEWRKHWCKKDPWTKSSSSTTKTAERHHVQIKSSLWSCTLFFCSCTSAHNLWTSQLGCQQRCWNTILCECATKQTEMIILHISHFNHQINMQC